MENQPNMRTMMLVYGNGTQLARIEAETDKTFTVRRWYGNDQQWYPNTSKIAKSDLRIISIDGVDYVPTPKKAQQLSIKPETFASRLTSAMLKGYWALTSKDDAMSVKRTINPSEVDKFVVIRRTNESPDSVVVEFDTVEEVGQYLADNESRLVQVFAQKYGYWMGNAEFLLSVDFEMTCGLPYLVLGVKIRK